MPYSERVEKKESWKAKYTFENDPANIIVLHDWYLQHKCGQYVGTLSMTCKDEDGNIYWSCSACQKLIYPQVVVAARLAQ